jgi:hypothetical protein
MQLFGPTGATANGAGALDAFAAGDGNAVRGTGHGAGAGVSGLSGATGPAVRGESQGTGPGGKFLGNAGGGGSDAVDATGTGSGHGLKVNALGSGQAIQCNGPETITGALTHTGAAAFRVLRKTNISSFPAAAFAGEAWDVVWLLNSGATGVVTLTDPNVAPLQEGIEMTFVVPGSVSIIDPPVQAFNTGDVQVHDHGGAQLVAFNTGGGGPSSGSPKSVTITTVSVGGTIKWDVKSMAIFI